MTIIALLVGILVGISLIAWERYRFKSQLKNLLTSLPDTADVASAFPSYSLVRREIVYLQQQSQLLEEELQIWETLLDKAPIGYLRVDEDNQLLWCNQQAQQLLKIDRWQPGQIRLLLELVRSYELDQLIVKTRHSQQPQVREWTFYSANYATANLTKLAYEKSLALKASSYLLSQGEVGVFLENQQPLVELSRSRDRLFSDLTHELRTPLTSISLVAEALQKRLQDPERRWVEQMLKEANRLMTLIQEWLDISQLEENPYQHLDYQAINLRQLIFTAWQTVAPLAEQKQVTLDYGNTEPIDLQADQSRLMQVFINLFDNAIKHSPSQGVIQVWVENNLNATETFAKPESVKINLIDSGSGFADSELPHIFTRLYRGDSSRSRQVSNTQPISHGSGLGLSIAERIIQSHGGSISAQNHPETGGAWLQLILPKEHQD